MARPRKAASVADSSSETAKAVASPETNPSEVTIYPLRSYMDAGEIKRRGGPGYTVPKRHADALIAQRVASTTKPDGDK